MSSKGRDQMLGEIDESAVLFRSADESLVNVMEPIRTNEGITNEMVNQSLQKLLNQSDT